MTVERYPDIEVYFAPLDIDALNAWLQERIGAELASTGKNKWRGRGEFEGVGLPVLVMASVADGFASLWIDSPSSPWPRDIDLARDINAHLQVEVRCSLGGWHPGDEPDRFMCLKSDGEESVIEWPDPAQ